jgi:hypothetical protein
MLSFPFLLTSCRNAPNNGASSCELVESKEISLAGNPDMGSEAYRIYQFIHTNDQSLLIGYSYYRHQLNFWNIRDGVAEYVVPLGKEGPDAIPEVNSFFFHNPDSIFIIGRFNIHLIDQQGKARQNLRINQDNSPLQGIDFSQRSIYVDMEHSSPLFYDPEEGCLYFPVKNMGTPQSTDYYKNNSICARLNVRTLRVEELPIRYPVEFTRGLYGMLDKPNITFLADRIVYNFKINSKVHVYDKRTGVQTVVDFPSVYTSNQIPTVSGNAMDDPAQLARHIETHPFFRRVLYDERRDVYYRLHSSAMLEERNQAGKLRDFFLTVIDGSLERFLEMRILPELNFTPIGVAEEGVLLFKPAAKEDDMSFQAYRFDCPG